MKTLLKLALLFLLFSCKKDSETDSPAASKPDPPMTNNIVFWRPNPDGGIFTINEKGDNEKKLLTLPANSTVAYPDWSPDHRIYFTGTLQGEQHAQIYSMQADGSDVVRITNNPQVAYSHLDVSSKSQLLYIKTVTDGGNPGLYSSAADGTQEKEIMSLAEINLKDISWVYYLNRYGIIYISDEVKLNNNEKVTNIHYLDLDRSFKTNLTGNFNKNKVYSRLSVPHNSDFILATASPDVNTTGFGIYVVGLDNTFENFEQLFLPAPAKDESWINSNMLTRITMSATASFGSLLVTDNENKLHLYTITGTGTSGKQLTQVPSYDAKVKNF